MAGRKSGNIVVLTGAGISKESGLDTFRDVDGLWSRVNLEDVATPEGFARNPKMVHDFYNHRRRELQSGNVRANAAHHALGRLEAEWPDNVLVVTQNIDALHEDGGSKNLIHMHGEMLKARCALCGDVRGWTATWKSRPCARPATAPAACAPMSCGSVKCRFEMERISGALSRCSLFLSIGTSGNVYPAAGFVQEAIFSARAHTVELNMEPSEGATMFAETVYGPATEVVLAYVERILAEGF